MKIFVQWTTDPPLDAIEIDSSQWSGLPKLPVPVGGEVIDSTQGWIFSISCQGVNVSGDHYAVVDLPDGSTAIAAWVDDIDDRPAEEFYGVVGLFFDPAFDNDPRVMQINTRQQFHVWANLTISDLIAAGPSSNRQLVGTFNDFVPFGQAKKISEFKGNQLGTLYANSPLIRHGINVSEALNTQHHAVRTVHGWREWIV